MIKKQQDAWNSVEPIIDKLRKLHQGDARQCCIEECKNRRWSPGNECLYCKKHSDPNTWCCKCKTRGFADDSATKLCSDCNLLCRTNGCEQPFVGGSDAKLWLTCVAFCHTHGCTNALAVGDPTWCSNCAQKRQEHSKKQQLKRDLAKRSIMSK